MAGGVDEVWSAPTCDADRAVPTSRAPQIRVSLDRHATDRSALFNTVLAGWLAGDHSHLVTRAFPWSAAVRHLVPDGWTVEASLVTYQAAEIVAADRDARVWLEATAVLTTVMVAARHPELAEHVVRSIEDRLRTEVPGRLPLLVRTEHAERQRRVDMPTWEEIESCYPRRVADRLGGLMGRRGVEGRGRLLLWHGAPGTGKTTAIKALLREWASWCDGVYVADPDTLFGKADYLVDLLTHTTDPMGRPTLERAGSDDARWRVVIAEDTDEFLRSSARRDTGAALGRLLNVTDGLLGDRVAVLVLLTTNEPVSRLHPALVRPGRCLSEIEFPSFTRAEASRWLGRPMSGPMTLAEILAERGDLGIGQDRAADGLHLGVYL